MRDDQIFGVIASVALLVWLIGRGGMLRDPRARYYAQLAAMGLLGAGLVYALFLTLRHVLA